MKPKGTLGFHTSHKVWNCPSCVAGLNNPAAIYEVVDGMEFNLHGIAHSLNRKKNWERIQEIKRETPEDILEIFCGQPSPKRSQFEKQGRHIPKFIVRYPVCSPNNDGKAPKFVLNHRYGFRETSSTPNKSKSKAKGARKFSKFSVKSLYL